MPASIVGAIILAAATGAFGHYFQNRAARITERRKLREEELHRAQDLFKDVSTTLDALHYFYDHVVIHVAVRKATGDVTSAEEDAEDWKAYGPAQLRWNTNINRFESQMKRYFDEECSTVLDLIGKDIDYASGLVRSTYYCKPGSIVPAKPDGDDKPDYSKYFARVYTLKDRLDELSDLMTEQINQKTSGLLGS